MAMTRRPTAQAYPTKFVRQPSAYWRSKGLVLSFLGNRLVYSRDTPIIPTLTTTGTPKNQSGPHGDAVGFGTTYGTGTTDMLTGGVLPVSATKARSVFTSVYYNSTGGGGLGRIYQNATGTGVSAGESFYANGTTQILYNNFIVASGTICTWTFTTTPPSARWATIGISIPDTTGPATLGACYIDGKLATTATNGAVTGGVGSNVDTNLTWGNRASDGARVFDGMIGVTHIFDTELSASDQRMLDADPNCVWASPNVRRTATSGGQTLTPGLFTNSNIFYAPTVTPGTTTLTPGLFSNSNQFFSGVVSLGSSQTLVPGLLASTNSFFAPTVAPGAVTLTPGLLTSTNSFFAPSVYFPVEFHDDHERSNIDISLSSITQDNYAPTVYIYPRLQLSDSYGNPAYEFFHLRVTGVLGKRPNFRARYYLTPSTHPLDAWGFQTTQRFMYSYDQVTWNYFDTHAMSGDNLNIAFKLNADFTGDTVYVASQRPFTGTMVSAMVAGLASTYSSYVSMPPSSAGNAYVAGTITSQTDERGRTIPAQDFYSMRITDDTQQPADGSPKRIAVLIAGQHASEDVGNWMIRGALEFLCSGDAKAVDARKNFVFYVYPHVNPMGRYGGHWRGDFNSAHPTYDGNRRWITTPNMECVTKHKDAITTDLAGRQIALWLDYHGGYSGYFLYSGSALYSQYQTKMLAYQAGITIFDVNPTSSSTYYADNTLGADLSTPVEASRDLQLTEAEIKTYGSYSIKGLVDLFADGAWPVLLPARLSNSNTFFAPTVTPPNATLTATRFDNTNTFFGPVVNLGGALTLVPTRLDNTNSFFAPIVTPGGTVLQPGIVVNTNSFFAPTVAPGPVTLTPGLFSNTNSFYSPTVSQEGTQTLVAGLFSNTSAFYAPTVTGGDVSIGTMDADRFDYRRALRIPNAYGPDPAIARMGQRMTRRNRW